jgi:CheY-like chemotaxis protein
MGENDKCALLGQILLASGAITREDLQEALYRQKVSGEQLGQVLVEMGALARRQLERALQTQSRLRGKPAQERAFVLVIDDDPEIGALLGDILEGAGYRVGIASDESEAIAAIMAPDGCNPALIVLDLGLPRYGGIEFLTILRKSGATSRLPVIVLTGRPDLEADIAARGLQISEFLAKPVSARKLLEVVEFVLSKDRKTASAPAR